MMAEAVERQGLRQQEKGQHVQRLPQPIVLTMPQPLQQQQANEHQAQLPQQALHQQVQYQQVQCQPIILSPRLALDLQSDGDSCSPVTQSPSGCYVPSLLSPSSCSPVPLWTQPRSMLQRWNPSCSPGVEDGPPYTLPLDPA